MSEAQYTREKFESELYSTYEQALSFLETGDLLSVASLLSSLLLHPLLASLEDIEFKYSIFLSLAHAKESLKQWDEALSLYYKANKLHQNSEKSLWLKLALICEKQGYYPQADQCYQECLRFSKDIAFDRILYEKMLRMGFLSSDWDSFLKGLTSLIKYHIFQMKC